MRKRPLCLALPRQRPILRFYPCGNSLKSFMGIARGARLRWVGSCSRTAFEMGATVACLFLIFLVILRRSGIRSGGQPGGPIHWGLCGGIRLAGAGADPDADRLARMVGLVQLPAEAGG